MTVHFSKFARHGVIITPASSGGWLVLTPRRHGWLHGSLTDARKDAAWLAKNFGGLAVLEVTTTTTT